MSAIAIMLLAQTAAVPCPMPVPLPREFGAWTLATTPAPPGTMLRTERPVMVTLHKLRMAALVATPGKPPRRGSFAGVYGFVVKRAGVYRVMLSDPARVDIVTGGQPLASGAQQPGPSCSGIYGIVSFDLTPGRYTLQLSGAERPVLKLLLARRP